MWKIHIINSEKIMHNETIRQSRGMRQALFDLSTFKMIEF
jgi:hypothetical protein